MFTTLSAGELPMLLDETALADTDYNLFRELEAGSVCRDIVTWPNQFAATTPEEVAAARCVCATCEVAYPCLILGLSSRGKDSYMYGGLTYEERKSLPVTPQMERDVRQMQDAIEASEPWNLV